MHPAFIENNVAMARWRTGELPASCYGNEHDLGVIHALHGALALPSVTELIDAEVAALKLRFPELGLSFGYIGNCDMAHGRWDDRSWHVFTNRCGAHSGLSVSWGYATTATIDVLLQRIQRGELASWCEAAIHFPTRH